MNVVGVILANKSEEEELYDAYDLYVNIYCVILNMRLEDIFDKVAMFLGLTSKHFIKWVKY